MVCYTREFTDDKHIQDKMSPTNGNIDGAVHQHQLHKFASLILHHKCIHLCMCISGQ